MLVQHWEHVSIQTNDNSYCLRTRKGNNRRHDASTCIYHQKEDTCWIAVDSSNKLTLAAPCHPTGADPWSPLHCFSLYTAEDLWATPWAETPRTETKTFTMVSSLLLSLQCRYRRLCDKPNECLHRRLLLYTQRKKMYKCFLSAYINFLFYSAFTETENCV